MNVTQIEETVKKLASDILSSSVDKDQFIYELMAAYGHRKTTVSRIKSGERNLAKGAGEVRAKRHIYFKHSDSNKVFSDIDDMKKEPSVAREKIRFIIATDFSQFVAVDTHTYDTLDIEFSELGKHFDFFLPWAGMEKAVYQGDNPADVKAAEKMAKLFDLIKADNFNEENKNDTAALHGLNVFLTRLLFCFFAEDTGIFTDNQFSSELESHTKMDGSDVDSYLNRLFEVLNTSKENRHDLPDYLAKFEYVNGGLFADSIASPKFSTKSRRMLIECGSELDWSGINPDIFGSMIQAVVHPDQRGGMGMHYTSVINIMKVIEPLFLDDLYAELDNIAENIDPKLKPSRLRKLHDRIANIKIFDPACGSGNFLIIAFKELRKLEMEIIKQLQEFKKDDYQDDFFDEFGLDSSFSRIKLPQFYGIELDDFAHEVAILSLWLAEHQMNIEFKAEFGECEPVLPLKQSGNIYCGNATRLDWKLICPNHSTEVYVLGNPPYLGFNAQKESHVSDIKYVFDDRSNHKYLDYISCWFYKAAVYAEDQTNIAFVSTNSICQGTQVPLIWPSIFSRGLTISFAYEEFYWNNNAKNKAAVICIIVGLTKSKSKNKYIYSQDIKKKASFINAYLADGSEVIVEKRQKPLSRISKMSTGNVPYDGGNLIISPEEKDELIKKYPESKNFILKNLGSSEFINGRQRYCIWIDDDKVAEAMKIPPIKERVEKVKTSRENVGKIARNYSHLPHRFYMTNRAVNSQLIIPRVSSMRRDYIPIGYLSNDVIISDAAQAIYDPDQHIFSLLVSKMHMAWVKKFAGRLKSDFRYSAVICYNTFPLPEVTEAQKTQLFNSGLEIISAREHYSDLTLAKLYDPESMPQLLKKAHEFNDSLVESIYSKEDLIDDHARLKVLLTLYELMTGNKNA